MASELFQAVSALKNVADGLKMISQYAEEVKDVQKRGEFMRIIGELNLELAETQIKLSEQLRQNDKLAVENEFLHKEIEALKGAKPELFIRDGMYYAPDGDGPFCTGCYDSEAQKIRLTTTSSILRDVANYKYQCTVCTARYTGKS